MVCSYFLHDKLCETSKEALQIFAEARTHNAKVSTWIKTGYMHIKSIISLLQYTNNIIISNRQWSFLVREDTFCIMDIL